MAAPVDVAPVDREDINAFLAGGLDYSGPPAVLPGSVFTDGVGKGLQPDQGAPIMWRSREGGLLQADVGDQDGGDDVLWALRDHVRTQNRSVTFSASQERNIASQSDLLTDMLRTLQETSTPRVENEHPVATSSTPRFDGTTCIGPVGANPSVVPGRQAKSNNVDFLGHEEHARSRRSCWHFIFPTRTRRRVGAISEESVAPAPVCPRGDFTIT
jgi:hypothetical protein